MSGTGLRDWPERLLADAILLERAAAVLRRRESEACAWSDLEAQARDWREKAERGGNVD